jgi:uncharacterized protein YoxC
MDLLTFSGVFSHNSAPMPPWAVTVLVLSAIAVAAAIVRVLLAIRRAVERAEGVLGILEQELRPMVGQVHALAEDVRGVLKETTRELERIEMITDQVQTIAGRVSGVLGALSGFTRAGQLVSLAVGVKKGFDVFVHRMRKE